jgi:hypothetical protein
MRSFGSAFLMLQSGSDCELHTPHFSSWEQATKFCAEFPEGKVWIKGCNPHYAPPFDLPVTSKMVIFRIDKKTAFDLMMKL